MNYLFSVWDVPAVSIALVGGVIAGVVLQAVHPQSDEDARRSVLKVWIVAAIGTIFFAGQAAQAFVLDDPSLDHATSRWALWLLFSVTCGVGAYAGHRVRAYQEGKR